MKKKTVTKVRRDKKRKVLEGIAHVSCTFNNTLVTITDRQGNKLTGSSAGACKFSGARKSTPTVAKIVAATAAKQAIELYGLETIQINIWGPGPGREMAARELASKFKVSVLIDTTGVPHNGCRPQNERRV